MLNSAHSFARIYALVCVNLRTRLRYSAHSFALIYAVVCCICHPLGPKNQRLQASKYSPVPWPSIRSATGQSVRFLQSMVCSCPRSWQPRQAVPVHLGATRQDSKFRLGCSRICGSLSAFRVVNQRQLVRLAVIVYRFKHLHKAFNVWFFSKPGRVTLRASYQSF